MSDTYLINFLLFLLFISIVINIFLYIKYAGGCDCNTKIQELTSKLNNLTQSSFLNQ